MVLGTAQFGMDYGIANVNGKPTKKEVFDILDLAWEKGIRRFDTAPGYGSEALLGEFIIANALLGEAIVLTKIPSLDEDSDYQNSIRTSLDSSLDNLGCPIEVLFFHNPEDSDLLLTNPKFFESLLNNYPISSLGVSVYEPYDVERLINYYFDLAFQFPYNVLDRRFDSASIKKGKRYARSIFLQGLLASKNRLRLDSPQELLTLKKEYHEKLTENKLDPICASVSFVAQNSEVDYFLFGVDSKQQLEEILGLELYGQKDIDIFEMLIEKTDNKWFDPRTWN
jgi:aryl-alcohol dehydrogenase-like predicted oxidoreductase